jgi:hypothetical protein
MADRNALQSRDCEGVFMAVGAAEWDESHARGALMWQQRGVAKADAALDQWKPKRSMAWGMDESKKNVRSNTPAVKRQHETVDS